MNFHLVDGELLRSHEVVIAGNTVYSANANLMESAEQIFCYIDGALEYNSRVSTV